jgi:hypothetical protein
VPINFKRLDELKAAQARAEPPPASHPKTAVELAEMFRRARTREEILALGPEFDRLQVRRFRKRLLRDHGRILTPEERREELRRLKAAIVRHMRRRRDPEYLASIEASIKPDREEEAFVLCELAVMWARDTLGLELQTTPLDEDFWMPIDIPPGPE